MMSRNIIFVLSHILCRYQLQITYYVGFCVLRLWSLWMWHCLVWWIHTIVSEEPVASYFQAELCSSRYQKTIISIFITENFRFHTNVVHVCTICAHMICIVYPECEGSSSYMPVLLYNKRPICHDYHNNLRTHRH